MRAAIVLLAFAVNGCVPRTPAGVAKPPTITRPDWVATEIVGDRFFVVARDRQSANEARAELCPPRTHACTTQPYEAFMVERTRK